MNVEYHEGNERRRNNSSNRRPAINNSHSCGTFFDWEPLGYRAGGGGKTTTLPNSKKQSTQRKHGDVDGETVTRTGERPEDHDQQEPAPSPNAINEVATTQIHQAVGKEEGR